MELIIVFVFLLPIFMVGGIVVGVFYGIYQWAKAYREENDPTYRG